MTPARREKTAEDIASLKGLGLAVRELREKQRSNQRQVADRAGLDLSTIYAVEKGVMELTWANLRRLATGLGVELPDLLRLSEDRAPG